MILFQFKFKHKCIVHTDLLFFLNFANKFGPQNSNVPNKATVIQKM